MNQYIQKQICFLLIWGLVLAFVACSTSGESVEKSAPTLKDAFQKKFLMGTALNAPQIMGRDTATMKVVKTHFNSIVAENIMKSGMLQPREGAFRFDLADQFVKFGEENNLQIHGHTLIWHSQAPRWFFMDKDGNEVSPEVLTERMRKHIHTVVGRYKGRVHSWDVVNEAILDDGTYRNSKFYHILGKDFIKLAFQFAHEADPEAELYYNDFSMSKPGKRVGVVKMVQELQEQGIRIDGIGMQGHIGLEHPELEEFEKSIQAFSDLGVHVMVTELDLSVLPSPWNRDAGANISDNVDYEDKMNPYPDGLPDSVEQAFDDRYLEFFNLFIKYEDEISRVTLWGVNDSNSWKNGWPIRGRTDYPLLFDRENKAKPVVEKLIRVANQ
ncbi:endo-1,4-beta-xylanase [Echinicola jeungdonensis]|uniref:Beta-xylanase n=1 Tax=Echinicola jeungdonensis TaxID=709343 RepID=A0ABV5JA00_9BACT|nr:endo-1,4-beta-xylanase [Echinicola jeungdonensis]MDN3670391.1 endo-1,4-beta-xylanase [Echinicola jeungdonensis]